MKTPEEILKEFTTSKHLYRHKAVTTHITVEAQKQLDPNNKKDVSYYYEVDEDDLLELIKNIQDENTRGIKRDS